MTNPQPDNPRLTGRAPASPALAAFLRGVERRGAVLAELQCGDADTGDIALGATMAKFRLQAGEWAMGEWPWRFWALLLAEPGLHARVQAPAAIELEATDRLAAMGSGPRAALLLRLAAGLGEADAAAVFAISEATYRLALQRALPHHPDGRADPRAWQRLREQVHHRIKTLPPARLARLGLMREAALRGNTVPGPGTAAGSSWGSGAAPTIRPRWLMPVLWSALALCALALAVTFWEPARTALEGPPAGSVWKRALPAQSPASRYDADAGLVAHRDFELLADPGGEVQAQRLGFHSWLAARGVSTPLPGAEAGPSRKASANDDVSPPDIDSTGETADEP
ncbi:hypothetical protein [Lysobacter sp. A289]